jgi:hypothetical protein
MLSMQGMRKRVQDRAFVKEFVAITLFSPEVVNNF